MATPPPGFSLLLERLLVARVPVVLRHRHRYGQGCETPRAVVPSERLIYLRQGALLYRCEDREHRFEKGALWLVPAWSHRSWVALGPCDLSWMEFLPGLDGLPMVSIEAAGWGRRFDAVAAAADPLLAEGDLKALLAHLLHDGEWHGVREAAPPAQRRSLHPVTSYLREHLHEPDLLGKVGAALGISASRLRARFREELQTTPGQYLEALRMQKARYFLLSGDLPVKEVAARCGFEDALYFSRRYRRFWGDAPTQHRSPSP